MSLPARHGIFALAFAFAIGCFTLIAGLQGKEALRVTVSPKLGISPLLVTVRVSIPEPTEEWSCPEVHIQWTEGNASHVVQDCEPGETVFTPVVRSQRFGPGSYEIEIKVQQGKAERKFQERVEVFG